MAQTPGAHTSAEIASQPEVWRRTLERLAGESEALAAGLARRPAGPLAVTGCGSTYYLAHATAAVLRQAGVAAEAAPASELALIPGGRLPESAALLAISRSGTTTETLWAAERFREVRPGGQVITICCEPDSPLARGADVALLAPDARELSVAQTRSFTSMALLGQALAGTLAGDAGRLEQLRRLPDRLADLMERSRERMLALGGDPGIRRFFFLGNGALYGLACEAMLKTKEMARAWAEAYHPLEFRHGPMALVDGETLVVGLISDAVADAEIRVLRDMGRMGARTLAIAEGRGARDWSGVDEVLELGSGVGEWARGPLPLPPLQWLAFARALASGQDPDRPANLTQVITL